MATIRRYKRNKSEEELRRERLERIGAGLATGLTLVGSGLIPTPSQSTKVGQVAGRIAGVGVAHAEEETPNPTVNPTNPHQGGDINPVPITFNTIQVRASQSNVTVEAGKPVSISFVATGAPAATYNPTFQWGNSGDLPRGMTFSETSNNMAVASGVVAEPGDYQFSVWAVDEQNFNIGSGQVYVYIHVTEPTPTQQANYITKVDLPPEVTEGTSYPATFYTSRPLSNGEVIKFSFTGPLGGDTYTQTSNSQNYTAPQAVNRTEGDNYTLVSAWTVDAQGKLGPVAQLGRVMRVRPQATAPTLSQPELLQPSYTAGVSDLHVGINVSGSTEGYQLKTGGAPSWIAANLDTNGIHFNSGVIPANAVGDYTVFTYLQNASGQTSNSINFTVHVVAPETPAPTQVTVSSVTISPSTVEQGKTYQATITGTFPVGTKFAATYTIPSGSSSQTPDGWMTASAANTFTQEHSTVGYAPGTYTLTALSVDGQNVWSGAASVTVTAPPAAVAIYNVWIPPFETSVPLGGSYTFHVTKTVNGVTTPAANQKISITFQAAPGANTIAVPNPYDAWTDAQGILRYTVPQNRQDYVGMWKIRVSVEGQNFGPFFVTVTSANSNPAIQQDESFGTVTVTDVVFTPATVAQGGSYNSKIVGDFALGTSFGAVFSYNGGADQTVYNWQREASHMHNVPADYPTGTYTLKKLFINQQNALVDVWTGSKTITVTGQGNPPPAQASGISIVKDNAGNPLSGVAVYDHDRVLTQDGTGATPVQWGPVAIPMVSTELPALSPGDWYIPLTGSNFHPGMSLYLQGLGNITADVYTPNTATLHIPRAAFDNVAEMFNNLPNPAEGTPPQTVFQTVGYWMNGGYSSDFIFNTIDMNGGGPSGQYAVPPATPPPTPTGPTVQVRPGQGTMRVGTTNAQGEIVYDDQYVNYLASLFPGGAVSAPNGFRTIVLPNGTTAIPGGLNLRYEYQSVKQTQAAKIATAQGNQVLDASITLNIGAITPPPVTPPPATNAPAITSVTPATRGRTTHITVTGTNLGKIGGIEFLRVSPTGPTPDITPSNLTVSATKVEFDATVGVNVSLGSYSFKITENLGQSVIGQLSVIDATDVIIDMVTVSPGEFTLKTGESQQMDGVVYLVGGSTNKLVTWASSDPSVATVSASGVVTAVKSGTVRIRATSTQNSAKSGEAKLTVESNALVQAPVITSYAPTFGIVGTTSSVEVIGQNLAGAAVAISGGGVTTQNTQIFDGGTRLRFDVKIDSTAAVGTRSLVIKTGNGAVSSTFEVRAANTNNNGGTTTTTTTPAIGSVTGVQVSLGLLNMNVGQTSTFSAMTRYSSGYFSGKVRAAAIDSSIASVQVNKDTGVITVQAIKAGSTSILVASDEDPSKAVSVMLTVTTATGATSGTGSATVTPNWYDAAYQQWLAQQNQNQNSTQGPQPQQATGRTYTVVRGDSLWRIAQQQYGDGRQWGRIFEANRDKIRNPRLIYPGQTLIIP